MLLESVKIFAMVISFWALYQAFYPKLGIWKPDILEHILIWLLIIIIWIAILK